MTFSRLAIIGPGLLGGSMAMAVRSRQPATRISIWARRKEAVDEITARGIADVASTDLQQVVDGADMVVFCVPIGAMAPIAEQIAPMLSMDALVTDVGSVKEPVVESLSRIFKGRARFVGSHPMAGSEQTGIEAAQACLFEGAVCIITPGGDSDPADVEAVKRFWELIGGVARVLDPAAHDEMVALVSHLPHIAAAALVNLVCAQNANALNFCGPGFRDTTRVASGSPGMWTEILGGNRVQVKKSLEVMIDQLREVVSMMDDDAKMQRFLAEAKERRDSLKKGK
jgi:prephenate dehydrogenase